MVQTAVGPKRIVVLAPSLDDGASADIKLAGCLLDFGQSELNSRLVGHE